MKAVIAQSDLVTAYGWGIDASWAGLMSGETAILSTPRFSRSEPIHHRVATIPDLKIAAGQSRAWAMLDRLLSPLIGKLDPQTPILLATTVCEIEYIERAVLENRSELAGKANPLSLLEHLKQLLGLTESGMVLSSACASSAAALARAAAMIESGDFPAVLVITCDAISEFVYAGFSTLLSLCDTPARPFDAGRCGLSLGEAAAWALITREDSQLVNPHSPAILGWSNTTDAVHMTAPDRAAGGLSRAIAQACQMAKVEPVKVGFIAAHGTATLYNDAMELLAFRSSLPAPVPIFSIKGGTGHTLSAAGLVQILIACRAMKLHVVPPTVGLSIPDEHADGWASGNSVALNDPSIFLSTNSGFGGVNTALVIGASSLNSAGRKARDPSVNRDASPINPELSGGGHQKASVLSVAWFSATQCGSIGSNGLRFNAVPPAVSSTKEMTDLIGRAPKYFARMTSEARRCLTAASLALRAVRWNDGDVLGIIGSGYDGWLAADQEYFRDYVAQGRSLGRANLFIYTLPTSAMSEIAIALSLTGPTLHAQAEIEPAKALIEQAMRIVENGEADGMVCVWSEGSTSICAAIGRGVSSPELKHVLWDVSTAELIYHLMGLHFGQGNQVPSTEGVGH